MNGNRNRYTSAPLYGMKNRKGRQADFSGGSDESRNGGQPPSGSVRRFQWLIPLIAVVLPALFILSLSLGDNSVKNICKMLFLALSLISLAIMWGGRAFGKNARYSVSLVMIALMVVSAVSLALTLPRNTSRTAASSTGTNAYFAGSSALDSVAVSAEDIGAPAESEPDAARGDTAASAAQMQLMAFMNYWGENQLDQMLGLCMPSWVNSKENPKMELFFILTNRVPLSYTIESISGSAADDSRTITITCLIRKQSNSEPEYYRLQVLMIRLNNNWYVDPNSLSGTKVQTTAAPDSEGAAVTAVPTAIPTPTPPVTDQTIIYYNPSGGKYYHVADTCTSVASQYEPMTQLYFKDLNSAKFKNLLPCPDCHAPERPSIVSE